jgi:hypothetical protein
MSRVFLALVLAATAVSAQDSPAPPRLEVRPPSVGERISVKIDSTFELDIVSRSVQDPDASTTRQMSYVRTQEFQQVVREVENGAAKAWEISCSAAKLQRSGTNLAPVSESSEIEGKTFVVSRGEKGRVVRLESGEAAPADAAGLGAWEDCAKLLPTGEAKEGAAWTADAAGLGGLIAVPDLATPTGSFDIKIDKMADGRAELVFTGKLEGKTVKGYDAKVTITEGRLVFDVAKGRPVSLSVAGSLEAGKDITQKVARANELKQVDEKVGEVRVTSRKLEVKVEFR